MQDQNPSRTAPAAAYLRAAHQIIDSGPRVLDDPIALKLLGPETEERILGARDTYMSAEAKALRSHVVLRSRYAEDRLESSVERGISQYVLVGAGFDTFALRQPLWAAALKIIEIDHPDTQRLKRSKISNAGIVIPDNVVFAGVNFEQESLENGLASIGVRRDKPTFFSWLGVTMYLTEAAIDSTLRCMTAFPSGSEAVITFLQEPTAHSSAAGELAGRVSYSGEPFVSYFTPENFKRKLIAAGFSETHLLTPALSARYFLENGSSLPNPKRVSIVSAVM
jgi:methyltransferase (TIGR00027 family)